MKGVPLPMRINLLSSFAGGILISTLICGAIYFVDKSDGKAPATTAKSSTTVKISENEMKKELETKGYVVQSKTEYDKNLKDAKAAVEKKNPSENNEPAKTVTKVIVNVSEGMTSIDVGKALVQGNLVQDAFAFSQDIEQKGIENRLRPGVYVVDSEMTYDQVVAAIYK